MKKRIIVNSSEAIMKILRFILLTAMIGPKISVAAYDGPAPLEPPKISVTVSFDAAKKQFKYAYEFGNPQKGTSAIDSIAIFIGFDASKEEALSSEDLEKCRPNFHSSFNFVNKRLPVIPVGATAQKGWDCDYAALSGSSSGSYRWSAENSEAEIRPGSTGMGFGLISYGLPGLREILLEPDIDVDALPEEYDENEEKTDQLHERVKWSGITIGPKAPPKKFVPSEFLTYILSLEEESVKQSWVSDPEFCKSLEAKLRNAQVKLDSGGKDAARGLLNAVMKELVAQKGKKINSTAFGLLYFNIQFLIDRL